MSEDTIRKCKTSIKMLGFTHPHFLLLSTRLTYQVVDEKHELKTMGITTKGVVLVNPAFVKKTNIEELGGVMAHEMLHLVLRHHYRAGTRDPELWNIAADMCINKALQIDQIKLPSEALYPPHDYTEELFTESLFEWLKKNPDKKPKASGNATAGCSAKEEGGDGDGEDGPNWQQIATETRAMCQQAGRGTSGVSSLLSPRQPKIDWKKVIKHGLDLALSRPGRDYQSFSRRHRRSPAEGPQFPGWRAVDPRVAIIIDVSGSMNREWINQIVAECIRLTTVFQNMNMYLCTHTSEVVWQGWVTSGLTGKFSDAVQFSGGTDPQPAYDVVKKAGRFDTIIHFTDCEFGKTWPEVPRPAKLVVGAFTRSMPTTPPVGSHVIPCEMEGY
jgi:predicted metal-dependent peptidase